MTETPPRAPRRGPWLLALAVFLVLFLKSPAMLLAPPLHAEDGTQMLAYYYCPRGPAGILRFYNGYVSLVPNAIGWLALRAPIEWAPTLLALAPFVLTGICLLLPYLLRLGAEATGVGTVAAASLLLAALPLGNAPLVANTTYSFWNGLLALTFLALAPPARHPASQVGTAVAAVLLAASHPLSIVVLPLYLVRVVLDRRERRVAAIWAAVLIGGVVYQLLAVQHAEARMRPPLVLLHLGFRYLVERVGFEGVLGSEARLALYAAGWGWLVTLAGSLVTLAAAWLCWRRFREEPRARGLILGLVYLVPALTFGVVAARNIRSGLLWDRFGEHYFYVPKALFWVALVTCAAPLVGKLARGRRVGMVVALVVYVLGFSWAERARYAVDPEEGRRIAALVVEVARQERAAGGRRGIDAVLDRASGGAIHLRAPAANQPCEE
jgi:hypothetical protein